MKRIGLVALCVGITGIAIVVYALWKQHLSPTSSLPFIDSSILAALPTKDASGIDTSHLKAGLTPPTNKWFSGLVLQKIPQTVYPTPLSFTPTATSFSVGLPTITTAANTIFGNQVQQPTTVRIAGAAHYIVTRYDELSVDLTYYSDDNSPLGTVTLIAGSPYVYYHSLSHAQLTISTNKNMTLQSRTVASMITPSSKSVVAGFDGTTFSQSVDHISASLPKGGVATFYTLPSPNGSDPLLGLAGDRVTHTNVSYEQDGSNYRTAITFSTANNRPTYYGLLPHQMNTTTTHINYDTIYGQQRMLQGTQLSFTTPAIPVASSLNLSKITPSDKSLLTDTLRREINATQLSAEDTYFGGKEMYRAAQLLDLANQLHQNDIATTIQQKLRDALTTWLSTTDIRSKKDFYYDTKIHGIVGDTASFGSDAFNDHHFHYGYFIYAASILAKYDSDFLTQYAPMVNLLVADIADYKANDTLPLRRMFDPYFGHSWASGSAPFNDGNNQESSSEAINAWTATSLWAEQTKNNELATEAGWMLSNEVDAAKHYWTDFSMSDAPYNQGYAHSIVSLNWGGKRDYATFFSTDPAATLGILLIPLNPTMVYQASFGDRITEQVGQAISQDNYNIAFGDYILMYASLRDATGALDKAEAIPDSVIDNGNSRSYMYAWIMSQKP